MRASPPLAVSSQEIVRVDDPAEGRLPIESAVPSVPIVVMKPASECHRTFGGTVIGLGVGAFPQKRLDKALRFAVRLRGVRSRPAMVDPPRAAGGGEHVRPVAHAIVGEHPLDTHTAPLEPRHRAPQEGRDGGPVFVTQHLGVRHPRAVIDADVDEFPADAVHPGAAVAMDAVPDAGDPRQLLGVDVTGKTCEIHRFCRGKRHAIDLAIHISG